MFSILCCALSSAQVVDLNYSLTFDGANNRIGVALEFHPQNSEKVTFTYGEPLFGGQTDIIDCLQNMTVSGVESCDIDRNTRQLTITPASKQTPVNITYDIIGKPTDVDDFKKDLFRPVISNESLYSHGLNLFLMPSGGKYQQNVSWAKVPPFPVIYMWDPGSSMSDTVKCTPSQVYMSLLVGSQNIEVTPVAFQKLNGYVVTSLPDKDKSQQSQVCDFFEKSMSGLRNFWHAEDVEDTYVFAMLPFSDNVTHSVGGIGLTGGFCSKYYKSPDSDKLMSVNVRHNLTHEMGHKWLGGPFSLGLDNQWFHEGFNDYLTYYVNYNSGILSYDELSDYWNKLLKSYYGSPVHNIPNEEVLANYWKIGDYNKIPYWRGAIFACYIDSLIRQNSDNAKDWRYFMLALKNRLDTNGSISMKDFTELLQSLLPKEMNAAELVEKHMIQGQDIEQSKVAKLPFMSSK